MARAASRQFDLAIVTAWHTARFALNGYADKGRLAGNHELSDLLSNGNAESKRDDDGRVQRARAIHFFHTLKAKGWDVQIERVVH